MTTAKRLNALNWFEIPAADFERTARFYEALLQITLRREVFAGTMPNAVFPYEDGIGGAVAQVPYAQPGASGTLIYLNARSSEILDAALARAEALGGRVLMGRTSLGPTGHIAIIADPEGNRVGLHVPAGA